MKNYEQSYVKARLEKDVRIQNVKERIGFDIKVANESNNGLLFLDFRKTTPPQYATKWPFLSDSDEEGWWMDFDRSHDDSVVFEWKVKHNDSIANIKVKFFSDYKGSQTALLLETVNNTTTEDYWKQCKKEIGTICTEGDALVFVYKNAYVQIYGNSQLSNNETLAEALAQWVFDQLKKAPKVAALPDNIDKWEWLIIKEDDAKTQSTLKEKSSAAPDAEARPGSVRGGGACPKTGYWWTPAMENSRRFFNERETMPGGTTAYGAIIWQWDDDQKSRT